MPGNPTEIERKFYLTGPPPFLKTLDPSLIQQGYLAIEKEGNEVRIRDESGVCSLTIKSPGEIERMEMELPLATSDFQKLWPLTKGRRIVKERFLYPYQGHQIEIDRYLRALEGLYIAEVEFSSLEAAEAFAIPGWMGVEVTGNSHFKNKNLSTMPGVKALISFL